MTKTPHDVNDFYLYKMYGWNREERDAIFDQYGVDIHWHSTPYPDAIEALKQIYKQHKLSFITARPMFCKDVTVRWLEHHNIPYHHLSLTEDKLAECSRLQVDILIDDAPHYAEQFIASNKPYILFNQPYNRHIEHACVYRARNWMDVMNVIERMEYAAG